MEYFVLGIVLGFILLLVSIYYNVQKSELENEIAQLKANIRDEKSEIESYKKILKKIQTEQLIYGTGEKPIKKHKKVEAKPKVDTKPYTIVDKRQNRFNDDSVEDRKHNEDNQTNSDNLLLTTMMLHNSIPSHSTYDYSSNDHHSHSCHDSSSYSSDSSSYSCDSGSSDSGGSCSCD
jgi:hypothetical protein